MVRAETGVVGKGRGERTAGILAIGVDAQLLDDLRDLWVDVQLWKWNAHTMNIGTHIPHPDCA